MTIIVFQIKLLYMDADMDESGSLEIEEFIPLMVNVVKVLCVPSR